MKYMKIGWEFIVKAVIAVLQFIINNLNTKNNGKN